MRFEQTDLVLLIETEVTLRHPVGTALLVA